MKIAVLTSGGDSQGMNAAVRAVVKTALYKGHEAFLVRDGFKGLVEDKIIEATVRSVGGKISKGGTFIGSARLPEFETDEKLRIKAADNLKARGIEGLVVIGGDGSYKGAMALHELGIMVTGVPATIDNDINSTDSTIGFDTAANICVESIDRVRDTSESHRRCSIVEVMGRTCGDLAKYAGIATGAEIIITQDSKMNDADIIKLVKSEMNDSPRAHVLIIITENILDSQELARKIEKATDIATRATILGFVQRGGAPTMFDRVLASRLGAAAAMAIIEGKSGTCVGIINEKILLTDINEALKMPKNEIDNDLNDLRGMLR